ncbi:hypothetical protein E2C01_020346 [Portunus trituberculatus]|uniref:Uncharacterized protein n=1 Tax=Portunus trituberculatus TaxID=210409 RepID=A0A5B7DZV2_PORTR|nr:hypothetical protein [Portunus trituberculatus]
MQGRRHTDRQTDTPPHVQHPFVHHEWADMEGKGTTNTQAKHTNNAQPTPKDMREEHCHYH